MSPEGLLVDVSPGACAFYGLARHELVGQRVEVLSPPSCSGDWAALAERLAAVKAVAAGRTRAEAPGGVLLEVELEAVPLPAGGYVCLVGQSLPASAGDVLLSATPEELLAWFEASPVAQARVALDGRILAVNPVMVQLLGMPASALVGHSGIELFPDEERPQAVALLDQLASGALSSASLEREMERPDAARLQTVIWAARVRTPDAGSVLAVAVEDVTELRAAENVVREQAGLFDALLKAMPVAVYSYDLDGRCTSSRGRALQGLGLADDELVGRSLLELHRHLREAVGAVQRGESTSYLVEQDGIFWEGQHLPLRGEHGEIVGGLGIDLDVTARSRAEQEVRAQGARLSALLRHASDVVLVVDAGGRLVYVSPAVRAHFGLDDRALFWKRAKELNHEDDRPAVKDAWRRAARAPGGTATVECRFRHSDGSWRWTEHRFTNLLDDPDVEGMVINLRETTQQRRAEAELRRLAVEDSVTGLANRTLLMDRAAQALLRGQRRGERSGLVLLDVSDMGGHNARLGQAAGDALLRALGRRVVGAVRPADSVARVGGDEFAVLFENVASEEDLRARAASLLAMLAAPLHVGGEEVCVALHAGVALSPAADAGALLAAAERALVARRGLGSAGTVPLQVRSTRDGVGVRRLRRAIEAGELRLHYQPVVRLATGRVVGAEALVRWQHPERGLLLPEEFVPLAEASGLVVELGLWVLREACTAVARWRAAGRSFGVGINLSPRQIAEPGFEQVVADVLAVTGVSPVDLIFEVTESALMDSATALDTLQALKQLGAHLALDDFGTGYSSLTYLKRFPVDALKIDRSFVAGLGVDADDEAIVSSVASLGRSVGKVVVAEGVETVAQLRALTALGVDQAQGHLWSPALPADELDAWLAAHRAALRVAVPLARVTPVAAHAAVPLRSDEARMLELHREGASLHTIAAALNAEGRRTPAGTRWHTRSVARIVAALHPER